MKFTLSWLKKFLDTESAVHEIVEALTSIGIEVEEIVDRSNELQAFEVASIISAAAHPSADKLKLCQVQTKDGVLQVICGASNAVEGMKVVLARIGTYIPNGNFKIKESTIRGEKSFGMLCSEEELLLSSKSSGIIELPSNAQIGECFIKYYGLDDPVFHVNVTPNRGDALGVYGIARDLAAKNMGELKPVNIPKIDDVFKSTIKINVDDGVACPLFSCREIRKLKNCPSPDWLQQLLTSVGINSISAIVDVTNYISYSFGQPLHAYDVNKLNGNIAVELLDIDAKFKALNGKEYHLVKGDLVIKDQNQVQSLAGVIGGIDSSCDMETRSILLEAAVFDPVTVTLTGRRLQIDTDSRHRFERGVDQSFTVNALDIATEMILSCCAGEASEMVHIKHESGSPNMLQFPVNYVERVTGLKLSADEMVSILEKLGFGPVIQDKFISLTIPSWRHDIAIYEDIVEEIVRIYGYDKLQTVPLPGMSPIRTVPPEHKRISVLKRIIARLGYDEVVTNSFCKSGDVTLFNALQDGLFVANPISRDCNYMRPTIIPNLLKLLGKNLARSIKDVALFEVGPVFDSPAPGTGERSSIAGVRCGTYIAKSCHRDRRVTDVFDIKADVEALLDYAGLSLDKCQLVPADLPYYHPTRSVNVKLGKNLIGCFGQIHLLVLARFDITERQVFAFEINMDKLPASKAKYGRREKFVTSDFQVSFRDYAFIIDKNQPVGELVVFINNINKKLIKSVELFDIYEGDKLPGDKKSVALRIQLQADDRTLNEADLISISQEIVMHVERKFYAQLRDKNVE